MGGGGRRGGGGGFYVTGGQTPAEGIKLYARRTSRRTANRAVNRCDVVSQKGQNNLDRMCNSAS